MGFLELLICKNLHYSIGYKKIFRNLGFQLNLGGLWILTGENGAGKSTLLKLIHNHKYPGLEWKQNIFPSYLGHEPGLYTSLSLFENLEYFSGILKNTISRDILQGYLEDFKLQKRIHDPIHTYSEGMRKKAGIIRALLPDSPLLLLDEPFNGLDEKSHIVLKRILGSYSEKKSVIIATHNPKDLMDIARGEWHLETGGLKETSYVVDHP